MPVERPTFTRTRIRAGYGRSQVDLAVERIVSDLGEPEPRLRPSDVAEMSFPMAMYRPGYDSGEVDDWLDEVQVALGGQPAPAPEPARVGEPPPSDASQTRSDVARALVMIAVVLFVAVKLYSSRF